MELRTAVAVEDDALAFLTVMVRGYGMETNDLLTLLEKPWKWQREYDLWHENGRPDDPRTDAFNNFAEACDRLAS